LNRRVSGPKSRSGPVLRRKNLLPLPALQPPIAEPTEYSLYRRRGQLKILAAAYTCLQTAHETTGNILVLTTWTANLIYIKILHRLVLYTSLVKSTQ